jgi:phosphoribosylformylglycinamidine synthase
LTYADKEGNPTGEYPANPNGSELNCAGLCDVSGQVFGLMPHPEAYLSLYNHPDWAGKKRSHPDISEDGEGLAIFKNIVKRVEGKE